MEVQDQTRSETLRTATVQNATGICEEQGQTSSNPRDIFALLNVAQV